MKPTDANVLIIWLFATSLLDTEVMDSSSEYPVAPSSAIAYSNNSWQTMSVAHRRLANPLSNVFPDFSANAKIGDLEKYFLRTVVHYKIDDYNVDPKYSSV